MAYVHAFHSQLNYSLVCFLPIKEVMGRLDHLVEAVYERYKDRYFPGESTFPSHLSASFPMLLIHLIGVIIDLSGVKCVTLLAHSVYP